MRTETDAFWMDAITGVLDRKRGTGPASVGVTSPCFASGASTTADPAPVRQAPADERAQSHALEHSSRIYDAVQVLHAPAKGSPRTRTTRNPYAYHAWSTEPLSMEAMDQARARAHFESQGWAVLQFRTATGAPELLARSAEDGSVARLAPAADGTLRVAVTTPAARRSASG